MDHRTESMTEEFHPRRLVHRCVEQFQRNAKTAGRGGESSLARASQSKNRVWLNEPPRGRREYRPQITVIGNSKHRSTMQDYQVRCTVAAMLYVGGQVKSYEEALKIADSMLTASRQFQA